MQSRYVSKWAKRRAPKEGAHACLYSVKVTGIPYRQGDCGIPAVAVGIRDVCTVGKDFVSSESRLVDKSPKRISCRKR